MAICEDCRQEMTIATTCDAAVLVLRGQRHRRERWRVPRGWEIRRCGDCGVEPGGVHHLGCDMEGCPACGGQLITCGCGDSDDGEDTQLYAVPG